MNATSGWLNASTEFFFRLQNELSLYGWVPWEPEPLVTYQGDKKRYPDARCFSRTMPGGHIAVINFIRSGDLKIERQRFGFQGSVSIRSMDVGRALIANGLLDCMQLVDPRDFESRLEQYGAVLLNFTFERLISRIPPILAHFASAYSRWDCIAAVDQEKIVQDVVGVIRTHVEPLLGRLGSDSELVSMILEAGSDVSARDRIATSSLPSVFAGLLAMQTSGPDAAVEIMHVYEVDLAKRQRAGRYPGDALSELRCMHRKLEAAWRRC